MTLTERASYIKGLADGCNLDKNSECGKLVAALIDLTADMAAEIADLREYIEEIDEDLADAEEYIEEIDEDLGDVEEFLDDECDCDCDDDDFDFDDLDDDEDNDGDDIFDCDGDCANCAEECGDEDDYFEIICPSCGETICFDHDADFENLTCPVCSEKFECVVDEEDFENLSTED